MHIIKSEVATCNIIRQFPSPDWIAPPCCTDPSLSPSTCPCPPRRMWILMLMSWTQTGEKIQWNLPFGIIHNWRQPKFGKICQLFLDNFSNQSHPLSTFTDPASLVEVNCECSLSFTTTINVYLLILWPFLFYIFCIFLLIFVNVNLPLA